MRALVLILALLFGSFELFAQSRCPEPPVLLKSGAANIFTEEQEIDFGEVAAEQMSQDLRVIEDEELAAPLRRIGERIARQMPQNKLQHRFFLIDEPEANAFALPGGRIYVTRKLITSTRDEDELAGVIAHEMGHQLNHDSAVNFTKMLKVLLNITSLGDREDIENRYHQLLDTYRKKSVSVERDEDRSQLNADQVSIFAMARAGYDPQKVVDFWDRFTERRGRKGNWFSDVFGSTAPETKRLREFANAARSLPASCRESIAPVPQHEYEKWRTALVRFNGFGKQVAVPHLVSKKLLNPPMRGEFSHLRFSPDGHYLLAQDEASIFILQREPLKVVFRIDAPDALPAHFTPDSESVVFHTESLRVYRWSITEQRETDVNDVYVFRGCFRSILSPDGSVLACFRPDPDTFVPVGIRLLNVSSGDSIFEKKNFIDASFGDGRAWSVFRYLMLSNAPALSMDFSSDSRYFLAGVGPFQVGYDLQSNKELDLPGSLKTVMETSFAFMGPDRVIGVDGNDGYDSKIVRISGQVMQSRIHIGPLEVQAATSGDFVMIRPLPDAPAGVMDLKDNKIFLASKTEALDVFDGTWVNERMSGEIALYRRPNIKPIATVTLPRGPLGSSRAVMFSPDLSLLALSERTRGKLWDLNGVGALDLSAFDGAYLESNAAMINFSPPNRFRKLQTRGVSEKELRKERLDEQGNTIARIDLDKPAMTQISTYQKRQRVYQIGSTFMVVSPKDADEHPNRDVTLEFHDSRTGDLLWSKFFKRVPSFGWNPAENILILAWNLTEKDAKNEIKQDPEAARLTESILQKEASYLIAVVNARTGATVSRFPIDTGKGSFLISDMHPAGRYLLFSDTSNRVQIYDLKGQRIGRLFGRKPAVSAKTDMLAIEREPGRIALYNLASMDKSEELTFDASVEYAQFSVDGSRLAVLTDRQEVYTVEISGSATTAGR